MCFGGVFGFGGLDVVYEVECVVEVDVVGVGVFGYDLDLVRIGFLRKKKLV